jgi:neutral ceramidase
VAFNKRVVYDVICVICVICGFSLRPAQAQLLAGVGKVDITPDVKASKIPLGGYAARRARPSTGVHDPVYARALVMQNGAVKVAVVSLDLCFLPANIKTDVAAELASAHVTIPADGLFLAATHTHCGPDPLAMHAGNTFTNLPGWTTYDEALRRFTAQKIAAAIREADSHLIPVKIGSAATEMKGLNRNRRGDVTVDPALTVLKVTREDGSALAAIVNFAAHPTLYDDDMMQISADWPGVMTADIEQQLGPGAVCLFLNGAEGDASPNGVDAHKGDDKVAAYGYMMSKAAADLLAGVMVGTTTQLEARTIPVTLPPRKASVMFIIAVGQFGGKPETARALVNTLMPTTTQLTLVRLGDLLLLGFPCEPSAEIGLAAKEAARKAGYVRPAVVALTNDWLAYCLTPQQYKAGKYEAMMSFYGDSFGPTLLSALSGGLAAGGLRSTPASAGSIRAANPPDRARN